MFATALRSFGQDDRPAPSLAFGLVGVIDATVNHWLAEKDHRVGTAEPADYLSRSVWYVLDGNLRALGIELDPDTPVGELVQPS